MTDFPEEVKEAVKKVLDGHELSGDEENLLKEHNVEFEAEDVD